MAVNNAGSYIAVADDNCTVRLFSLHRRLLVASWHGSSSGSKSLCFAVRRGVETLLIHDGGSAPCLRELSLPCLTEERSLGTGMHAFSGPGLIAFSEPNDLVLVAYWNCSELRAYDASSLAQTGPAVMTPGFNSGICMSTDGLCCFVYCPKVDNIPHPALVTTFRVRDLHRIDITVVPMRNMHSFVVRADGTIIGCNNGELVVFDTSGALTSAAAPGKQYIGCHSTERRGVLLSCWTEEGFSVLHDFDSSFRGAWLHSCLTADMR